MDNGFCDEEFSNIQKRFDKYAKVAKKIFLWLNNMRKKGYDISEVQLGCSR